MKRNLGFGLVVLFGVVASSCSPSKYDFESSGGETFSLEDHIEEDVLDPIPSPSPSPLPSVLPSPIPSPVADLPPDYRCGEKLEKLLVCHVPPGNPANAHTICVSVQGAVNGHGISLETGLSTAGDRLGPCLQE